MSQLAGLPAQVTASMKPSRDGHVVLILSPHKVETFIWPQPWVSTPSLDLKCSLGVCDSSTQSVWQMIQEYSPDITSDFIPSKRLTYSLIIPYKGLSYSPYPGGRASGKETWGKQGGSPWPPDTLCSSRCAWCHRWRWSECVPPPPLHEASRSPAP